MTYDINKMLDSLEATLVANAATLATSLSVNYPTIGADNIIIGDPKRITRQVDQYPCIILTPKTKSQEWDELGINSSNKMGRQLTIPVDILCLCQAMSDSEDSDRQARTLSKNVESVLETNIEKSDTTSTVSDGWHTVMANNVIYDGAYSESEQTYVSSANIEAEFKIWGYR